MTVCTSLKLSRGIKDKVQCFVSVHKINVKKAAQTVKLKKGLGHLLETS